MTNDNNFTYANVLYEYYGDARISPDTDEFTLTICRDSILISHLADNNAYLRTRGARMTRLTLQHFSSDLTLIVFAIHRHLHIAKVFELASRLFFSLAPPPHIPLPLSPFLSLSFSLPWHVFRVKKST